MNICPVCGYPGLEQPPENFEICPSCHTEFGYSDIARTHDDLRNLWIVSGLRWASPVISPPPKWNPIDQLKNISVNLIRSTSEAESATDFIDLGEEENVINVPWGRIRIQGHRYAVGKAVTDILRGVSLAAA